MKNLSNAEVKNVNGGFAPVVWFAAGVIARSAIGTAVRSTVRTAYTSFATGVVVGGLKSSASQSSDSGE